MKHLVELDPVDAAVLHVGLMTLTIPPNATQEQRDEMKMHEVMALLALNCEPKRFAKLGNLLHNIAKDHMSIKREEQSSENLASDGPTDMR